MLNFGRKRSKKLVGELRKSKIVHGSGCAALVDFPGFSGIIGGQNLWPTPHPERMKIYEKRLEDQLGKEYFLQVADEESYSFKNDTAYKIPIIRFPEMYYCPSCNALDYARKLSSNYASDRKNIAPLKCNNCSNKELIPSRFIVVCENGHMDEFPYKWWVHSGKVCEKPRLELKYQGLTGGLDSIIISCKYCKQSRTMANILNKEATVGLTCQGRSPWLGKEANSKCDRPIRVLLRGSNNIYYPEIMTALTIPPWSNTIQKIINEHVDIIKQAFADNIPKEFTQVLLENCFKNIKSDNYLNLKLEDFITQARLRFASNKSIPTNQNLDIDEYKAFTDADVDDRDFKTVSTPIDVELQPYIKKIKLVKRLREVKVLTGFRRISAYENEGGYLANISTKPEKWLPAVELLGEGIFFEFNKETLKTWAKLTENRYAKMKERFINENQTNDMEFSPISVALHTFAHLLMRELAYNCGYELASLTEKLYVSKDEEDWMAGILIYTATTSSDGSLGGLVRQGEKTRLSSTIKTMLNRALWCSNDPICLESTNQGYKSLNYAACHACTLIPEVSCKYHNTILDRQSIIGNFEDRKVGLFSNLIE